MMKRRLRIEGNSPRYLLYTSPVLCYVPKKRTCEQKSANFCSNQEMLLYLHQYDIYYRSFDTVRKPK